MKAVKHGVELQIPALGVTQVKQAGLQPQPPGAHQQLERAGVVLHLRPGLIGHPLDNASGLGPADAQIPQLPRQGRVFDHDAVLFPQFFHHPLGVASHSWCSWRNRSGSSTILGGRMGGGICPDWAMIRRTTLRLSVELTGNGPLGNTFLMQQEDRFTLVRSDHGVLKGLGEGGQSGKKSGAQQMRLRAKRSAGKPAVIGLLLNPRQELLGLSPDPPPPRVQTRCSRPDPRAPA